jgi:anaerobic ribonucleoside-triphosphate reductase activating protein
MASKILQLCDILVDGEYEEDKRDLKLEMRGSSNQRIIVLNTQDNIAKIYSNKTVTSNSLRDDIKYKLN